MSVGSKPGLGNVVMCFCGAAAVFDRDMGTKQVPVIKMRTDLLAVAGRVNTVSQLGYPEERDERPPVLLV